MSDRNRLALAYARLEPSDEKVMAWEALFRHAKTPEGVAFALEQCQKRGWLTKDIPARLTIAGQSRLGRYSREGQS